ETFQGHTDEITCIDISADSTLLVCGTWRGTTWIWSMETNKLVVGPLKFKNRADFEVPVGAVRFSQDSKKFAVKSSVGKCLEVWDVQAQKLDLSVGEGHYCQGISIFPPLFWATKDRTIVTSFSFTDGPNDVDEPKMIYEFDPSTLETVGAPFEGHTRYIESLALSFDCALLASSSSYDPAIKLWAFESRQLLACLDFHDPQTPNNLIFSPNLHQLAYTAWV
ncbi:uncharacterized protein EDB91DRAFT_1044307, partial [Suillus paluster]|uniref:uncharacterized protein n=1 Tax=Suillus paluster TaxID=48578 RepID=UPI001B85B7F2